MINANRSTAVPDTLANWLHARAVVERETATIYKLLRKGWITPDDKAVIRQSLVAIKKAMRRRRRGRPHLSPA